MSGTRNRLLREQATIAVSVESAVVGEIDPPSKHARRAGVPLCGRTKRGYPCTRASGHREAGRDHPAHQHVHAPAPNYIVKEVW